MPSTLTPADELLALCERLIEGTFGPEDKERLEALVLGDPALLRRYVEYMHQHAALREASGGAPARALGEIVAGPVYRRPRWPAYAVGAATVAALAIAVVMMPGVLRRAPAPVATLASTKGSRWEGATLPTEPGARLPPGTLRLAQGLATLTFASGATVVMEGPAELELVSPMLCLLRRGSIVAKVPPSAIGFEVRAPTATVIDHGTEFGVTADEHGATQVEVLSGLVEARHAKSGELVRLETGQGALFDPSAMTARASLARSPERAVGSAAPASRSDLVISSASGRGRTGWVASGPPDRRALPAAAGLLLVKSTDDALWQRKAYLAFDLAPLAGRTVRDATLTLVFAPTGLGYASFVPDATFTVYGIGDQRFDRWEPGTLRWGDDPGPVPLGSFVVPQGAGEGSYAVSGAALANFMAGDSDGIVTFVVVRQTRETRTRGLVHGIVGNDHASAAAPTLRLTLK